ncbi:hypothetical protein CARUB_v10006213mg [Capsella rubella]|uniref:Ubiquitin-like domain-containing protein n=1 Tax=Capsella rubella TaxID=81985 RepID=R0GZR2_9BRAS|nr:putative small ubiquitin-related modifier 4 [Capsella rubella]EOA17815.1 hypothetical protein CARUB_v10006213mg [Capsella rubella]
MSEGGSQICDNTSTLQSKVRSKKTRRKIDPNDCSSELIMPGEIISTTSRVYERSDVKKKGKKRKVAKESTHVTLNVMGEDEEGVRVFKVRRDTKLLKLMEQYHDLRGFEWNTFRFLLDGTRIREYNTPDELELKDGDEIDAMLYQPRILV